MKELNIWRYCGAMGVVLLWTGIITAMHRAYLGIVDSRPLSYLGVNQHTGKLFSFSLLASSALFIGFAFYVRRAYKTGNRFMAYFLVGQAGQAIAAVAPYGSNSRYRLVHTIAAFTLAFSLPLLIREFARSQKHNYHYRLYRQLMFAELAFFMVGMGIFTLTRGIAPIGEALPAIGFHVWILAVTWTTT